MADNGTLDSPVMIQRSRAGRVKFHHTAPSSSQLNGGDGSVPHVVPPVAAIPSIKPSHDGGSENAVGSGLSVVVSSPQNTVDGPRNTVANRIGSAEDTRIQVDDRFMHSVTPMTHRSIDDGPSASPAASDLISPLTRSPPPLSTSGPGIINSPFGSVITPISPQQEALLEAIDREYDQEDEHSGASEPERERTVEFALGSHETIPESPPRDLDHPDASISSNHLSPTFQSPSRRQRSPSRERGHLARSASISDDTLLTPRSDRDSTRDEITSPNRLNSSFMSATASTKAKAVTHSPAHRRSATVLKRPATAVAQRVKSFVTPAKHRSSSTSTLSTSEIDDLWIEVAKLRRKNEESQNTITSLRDQLTTVSSELTVKGHALDAKITEAEAAQSELYALRQQLALMQVDRTFDASREQQWESEHTLPNERRQYGDSSSTSSALPPLPPMPELPSPEMPLPRTALTSYQSHVTHLQDLMQANSATLNSERELASSAMRDYQRAKSERELLVKLIHDPRNAAIVAQARENDDQYNLDSPDSRASAEFEAAWEQIQSKKIELESTDEALLKDKRELAEIDTFTNQTTLRLEYLRDQLNQLAPSTDASGHPTNADADHSALAQPLQLELEEMLGHQQTLASESEIRRAKIATGETNLRLIESDLQSQLGKFHRSHTMKSMRATEARMKELAAEEKSAHHLAIDAERRANMYETRQNQLNTNILRLQQGLHSHELASANETNLHLQRQMEAQVQENVLLRRTLEEARNSQALRNRSNESHASVAPNQSSALVAQRVDHLIQETLARRQRVLIELQTQSLARSTAVESNWQRELREKTEHIARLESLNTHLSNLLEQTRRGQTSIVGELRHTSEKQISLTAHITEQQKEIEQLAKEKHQLETQLKEVKIDPRTERIQTLLDADVHQPPMELTTQRRLTVDPFNSPLASAPAGSSTNAPAASPWQPVTTQVNDASMLHARAPSDGYQPVMNEAFHHVAAGQMRDRPPSTMHQAYSSMLSSPPGAYDPSMSQSFHPSHHANLMPQMNSIMQANQVQPMNPMQQVHPMQQMHTPAHMNQTTSAQHVPPSLMSTSYASPQTFQSGVSMTIYTPHQVDPRFQAASMQMQTPMPMVMQTPQSSSHSNMMGASVRGQPPVASPWSHPSPSALIPASVFSPLLSNSTFAISSHTPVHAAPAHATREEKMVDLTLAQGNNLMKERLARNDASRSASNVPVETPRPDVMEKLAHVQKLRAKMALLQNQEKALAKDVGLTVTNQEPAQSPPPTTAPTAVATTNPTPVESKGAAAVQPRPSPAASRSRLVASGSAKSQPISGVTPISKKPPVPVQGQRAPTPARTSATALPIQPAPPQRTRQRSPSPTRRRAPPTGRTGVDHPPPMDTNHSIGWSNVAPSFEAAVFYDGNGPVGSPVASPPPIAFHRPSPSAFSLVHDIRMSDEEDKRDQREFAIFKQPPPSTMDRQQMEANQRNQWKNQINMQQFNETEHRMNVVQQSIDLPPTILHPPTPAYSTNTNNTDWSIPTPSPHSNGSTTVPSSSYNPVSSTQQIPNIMLAPKSSSHGAHPIPSSATTTPRRSPVTSAAHAPNLSHLYAPTSPTKRTDETQLTDMRAREAALHQIKREQTNMIRAMRTPQR